MTNWNPTERRSRRTPELGEQMPLDRSTPRGLFETKRGDRYVVSFDVEYGPLAVILRHRTRPAFTWRKLMNTAITSGRWWGPLRIDLSSRYEPDCGPKVPGTLFVMEAILGIDCEPGPGGGRAIALGVIDAERSDMCDADSWTIHAARLPFLFCRKSPRGKLRYGPAPFSPVVGWACDDFVELGAGQ